MTEGVKSRRKSSIEEKCELQKKKIKIILGQ